MATVATGTSLIEASARKARGKNEARRVRREGRVPATLYGAGQPPVSLSVDPRQVLAILHSAAGHNTIFDLKLGDEVTKSMIVAWQRDPVHGAMLHLDFKRIAMDQRLKVSVPVVLTGEAVGVKQEGGILEQVLREIELECLPADIPVNVTVDIAHLSSGQVLRVKDLPHGGKLHFLTNEEAPVAHIVHVKEVVVAAPVEAAVAEGAAPAEPEVIKKGKQEAEAAPAPAAERAEKGKEKEKKEK
jgi:large subunit ribosomal protein L25